jgi:hypothetical protein
MIRGGCTTISAIQPGSQGSRSSGDSPPLGALMRRSTSRTFGCCRHCLKCGAHRGFARTVAVTRRTGTHGRRERGSTAPLLTLSRRMSVSSGTFLCGRLHADRLGAQKGRNRLRRLLLSFRLLGFTIAFVATLGQSRSPGCSADHLLTVQRLRRRLVGVMRDYVASGRDVLAGASGGVASAQQRGDADQNKERQCNGKISAHGDGPLVCLYEAMEPVLAPTLSPEATRFAPEPSSQVPAASHRPAGARTVACGRAEVRILSRGMDAALGERDDPAANSMARNLCQSFQIKRNGLAHDRRQREFQLVVA